MSGLPTRPLCWEGCKRNTTSGSAVCFCSTLQIVAHAPLETDWILLQVTNTFEAVVGSLPPEAFITSYGCEENLRCESH